MGYLWSRLINISEEPTPKSRKPSVVDHINIYLMESDNYRNKV